MPKTCQQPDRDVPTLVCGYPLPCPYHTLTIDLGAEGEAAKVDVPKHAEMSTAVFERTNQVIEALKDDE